MEAIEIYWCQTHHCGDTIGGNPTTDPKGERWCYRHTLHGESEAPCSWEPVWPVLSDINYDLAAGIISTIPITPAERHPEDMLKWAKMAVNAALGMKEWGGC